MDPVEQMEFERRLTFFADRKAYRDKVCFWETQSRRPGANPANQRVGQHGSWFWDSIRRWRSTRWPKPRAGVWRRQRTLAERFRRSFRPVELRRNDLGSPLASMRSRVLA